MTSSKSYLVSRLTILFRVTIVISVILAWFMVGYGFVHYVWVPNRPDPSWTYTDEFGLTYSSTIDPRYESGYLVYVGVQVLTFLVVIDYSEYKENKGDGPIIIRCHWLRLHSWRYTNDEQTERWCYRCGLTQQNLAITISESISNPNWVDVKKEAT